MKTSLTMLLAMVLVSSALGQTLPRRTVRNLPAYLDESSGMLAFGRNLLLLHNDSGGDANLYIIDTLGANLGTITIGGATATDWEDIARDDRYIYIGDFGNNSHLRTDLRIYKIPIPAIFETQTITAEAIEFWYPDQTEFPPPDSRKVFDCEAMVALGDSLYLFSKNWSSPFTGWTKCYSLPKTPGAFEATLLDSFNTGAITMYLGQITAADLSPTGDRLGLLGYGGLWLFSGFAGSDFFGGELTVFSLDSPLNMTQIEGLSFISENEIFYADEYQLVYGIPRGQKLYYADLGPALDIAEEGHQLAESFDISASPNPFNSAVTISIESVGAIHGSPLRSAQIEIFDIIGRRVDVISTSMATRNLDQSNEISRFARNDSDNEVCLTPSGQIEISFHFTWSPSETLPSGIYFVKAETPEGVSATKRIVFLR